MCTREKGCARALFSRFDFDTMRARNLFRACTFFANAKAKI